MRTIDADALVARLEDDASHMKMPMAQMFTYAAINDIQREPTVVVPQWIPCSERMPDPDTWVLVSCDEDVTIMAVTEHGEWYFADGDFTHGKVDAWMELPKPYMEDKNEN